MDLKKVIAELERKGKVARPPGSITLPLPIYGGRAFAARFRVLPPDDIAALGDGFEEGDEENVEANAEAATVMISDACRYLLARTPSGTYEPLTGESQQRLRFDAEFAGALGLELHEESAAAVVRAVWTVEDDESGERMFNAAACGSFGQKLLTWMQDTSRPVEDAIVGEARGGATSSEQVAPPVPVSTPASSSPSATEG